MANERQYNNHDIMMRHSFKARIKRFFWFSDDPEDDAMPGICILMIISLIVVALVGLPYSMYQESHKCDNVQYNVFVDEGIITQKTISDKNYVFNLNNNTIYYVSKKYLFSMSSWRSCKNLYG